MKITKVEEKEPTIVLNLMFGRVINTRKISNDNVETEIDTNMLTVSVDLFDAPELRACQNFQAAIKNKIKRYSTPSFFRGGMYKVKVAAMEKVDAMLVAAVPEFEKLVRAFADVVDIRREESKERLKNGYDPSLFPSKEQILRVYRIDWDWLEFGTPNVIQTVSADIFARERVKAEERFKKATEGVTALLATEAKKLADHLVDRLTPGDDGKPKQIRQAAVDNITKFLETFNLRNLSNSEELESQIKRIDSLIKGVSAEYLRDNEALREHIAESFTDISSKLDSLVVDKPRRFMAKE